MSISWEIFHKFHKISGSTAPHTKPLTLWELLGRQGGGFHGVVDMKSLLIPAHLAGAGAGAEAKI